MIAFSSSSLWNAICLSILPPLLLYYTCCGGFRISEATVNVYKATLSLYKKKLQVLKEISWVWFSWLIHFPLTIEFES
jgi:hypothetical protein